MAEGYSKATMLTFMNVLLTGIAQTWWTLNQRKITSYDEFRNEFKKEYFPEEFDTTAFIDLCNYKQKEEPVMKYLTAFQTRASYCEPYPSEAQMVSILKRNVREKFQVFLALKKPLNFAEVKNACKEKSELDTRNNTRWPRDEKSKRPERTGVRQAFALDIDYDTTDLDEEVGV